MGWGLRVLGCAMNVGKGKMKQSKVKKIAGKSSRTERERAQKERALWDRVHQLGKELSEAYSETRAMAKVVRAASQYVRRGRTIEDSNTLAARVVEYEELVRSGIGSAFRADAGYEYEELVRPEPEPALPEESLSAQIRQLNEDMISLHDEARKHGYEVRDTGEKIEIVRPEPVCDRPACPEPHPASALKEHSPVRYYYTVAQVASLVGLTRASVQRHISEGKVVMSSLKSVISYVCLRRGRTIEDSKTLEPEPEPALKVDPIPEPKKSPDLVVVLADALVEMLRHGASHEARAMSRLVEQIIDAKHQHTKKTPEPERCTGAYFDARSTTGPWKCSWGGCGQPGCEYAS
jgi:hypothetical protein